MRYELYYWPGIPGRGEFVRLALEDAGADYVDLAQLKNGESQIVEDLMEALADEGTLQPPFAPPFLKADGLVISHVANILQFLGPRLGLAPEDEAGRCWVHGLQLTLTDFVAEIHDVHHPVSAMLYYEEQKAEAMRRAQSFREERLPKYLGYFERVLARNPEGPHQLSGACCYADLSLFHVVAGLRYAFPNAMRSVEPQCPLVGSLSDRVAARPNVAAYLGSDRRLPFNESGVFRHYPELDTPA